MEEIGVSSRVRIEQKEVNLEEQEFKEKLAR